MKYLLKLDEFLKENFKSREFSDIIYGEHFNIFKNKIRSYHGKIEDGLIVRFYLKEFLKYYNESELNKINDWSEFIEYVNKAWNTEKVNPNQEIVFRRGNITTESFFSNNIYVASVYSGILNAYILNFKNPYILDCKESDWMNIEEPEIMKGESYDGTLSTDNIVEFIKEKKVYDGIIFLNLYEGSGAEVFGTSNIYVSLDEKNIKNITNNEKSFLNEKLKDNQNTNILPLNLYNYVRSSEFKKWFGDWENNPSNSSKVVDEKGEPLICNHSSTEREIDTFYGNRIFRTEKSVVKPIWFSYKNTYANDDNITQYKCFLNIRNIFDFSKEEDLNKLRKYYYDVVGENLPDYDFDMDWQSQEELDLPAYIYELGYDGYTFKDEYSIAVFDSKQIKCISKNIEINEREKLNEASFHSFNNDDILTNDYIKDYINNYCTDLLNFYIEEYDLEDEDEGVVSNSPEFFSYVKDELESNLEEAKENIYYRIDYKTNKIRIYRAISVNDNWIEHLKTQGKRLGIYWSWDYGSAEPHWGYGKINNIAIIEAEIHEMYIDWKTTLEMNTNPVFSHEKEIRLFKNTPIQIKSITINDEEIDISIFGDKTFIS